MRKFAVIIAVLLLAVVLVSGCQSKAGTNGYATYSGNSPAPSGGGGCGRFADVGPDSCAEHEAAQDTGISFNL